MLAETRVWQTMAYEAVSALAHFTNSFIGTHFLYKISGCFVLRQQNGVIMKENILSTGPNVFKVWPVLKIFVDMGIEEDHTKCFHFYPLVCPFKMLNYHMQSSTYLFIETFYRLLHI